ncbi:hypothetical protein EFL95_14060 [Nocardioides marmorisolisilvae]|uniref:PKD domain-containing protein n=1 Tax=Nocardioides marmorisolisilvae TaxID=1542737 RepID=A0A3N0DWQ4_9ACTN|nr:hypothetical protein EFL95_14060 [Nocardioides marmorisolisilvae]
MLQTVLLTVAVALVPTLAVSAANAVGTGSPVIVTPADGESYYSHEVPDLVVDFGNAPYGSYDWSVTDADSNQVLHSGTFDYDAADPDQNDLADLTDLGLGGYTATITSDGGTVTSSFGTFELGPPPVECQIEVAAVRVVGPTTAVYPRFHGCEGQTETWAVRHRVGNGTLTFGTFKVVNGKSAGPWRFKDSWPTGVYAIRSREMYGYNTSTVVRLVSRISLTAGTKVGGHFRISGDVTRYVPSADGFRGWANRPVAISYKNCAAGCAWRFLGTDHTDSTGHFSSTVTSSQARYYRATVGSTTSVWGRTSAPVKR